MKRLALLAVTAFMAVILSACGESAQKKADDANMNKTQQQDTLDNAAKDTDSKLQPDVSTDTSGAPTPAEQPVQPAHPTTQSGQ